MCLLMHKCIDFLTLYLEVVMLQHYTVLSNDSPQCCTAVLCNANLMDRTWFIAVVSSVFPILIVKLIIFTPLPPSLSVYRYAYIYPLAITEIILDNQPTNPKLRGNHLFLWDCRPTGMALL